MNPPSRPGWFTRFLEWLFHWAPGVHDDEDRLKAYGRSLADRHGSDVQAYLDSYGYTDNARTRPINDIGVINVRQDARDDMVSHLADRMIAEAKANGDTVDRDVAESRAAIAVDAMLAKHDENRASNAIRGIQLSIPESGETPEASNLASTYFAAKERAQALGGPWPARLEAALHADISADNPIVAGNPDRADRARTAVRESYVANVAYMMALAQSGQLSNVPDAAIDGLLGAQQAGRLNPSAVQQTASALQRLSPEERARVLDAIGSAPPEKQAVLWALVGREHFALSSSDANERLGSIKRIENAAGQARTMNADQVRAAFDNGTLGLEKSTVQLVYRVGKKDVTVQLPVYYHPAISDSERARYGQLVHDAYQNIPYAAVQRMMAGEANTKGTFNLQFYTRATITSGSWSEERPDGLSRTAGWYSTDTDVVRLDTASIERALAAEPGKAGRNRAINVILHESSHYLDDLANPLAKEGFFITRDPRGQDPRFGDGGDLAAAWRHFSLGAAAFRDLTRKITEDADATSFAQLSIVRDPTPAQDGAEARVGDRVAGRSGAVTPYAAKGGDEKLSQGGQLGEWFAETSAAYLNPATRDRLRQIDPVAYRAMALFYKELGDGKDVPTAMRDAFQFSLSTEVAGKQGRALIGSAASDKPLSVGALDDLDRIASAYQLHADALDGWTPFANDPDLKSLRAGEAAAGAAEGRHLLEAIAARKQALEGRGLKGSDEYRRLSDVENRLSRSVDMLERRRAALSP
jgi:hypothetical protein